MAYKRKSLKKEIRKLSKKISKVIEKLIDLASNLIYVYIMISILLTTIYISNVLSQSTKVAIDIANISITVSSIILGFGFLTINQNSKFSPTQSTNKNVLAIMKSFISIIILSIFIIIFANMPDVITPPNAIFTINRTLMLAFSFLILFVYFYKGFNSIWSLMKSYERLLSKR